jgi:sugar phosphate isomerase/epimerase
VKRREALKTLGGFAAGLSLPGSLRRNLESFLRPVGVQLYTVRDSMTESVDATLAAIAEIGYDEVEFAGFFGHTPGEMARMLRDNGLISPASHVVFETITDAWEETLDAAAEVGNTHAIVPWLPPEARTTISDYQRTADLFNSAGEAARQRGMRFGYHNHDFEFAPIDGLVPFDLLCDNTDPTTVDFELDIFWITHGGDDPNRVFQRWPGRFPMVHVKDRSHAGEQVDIGAGYIDWRNLLLSDNGIRSFFIEHDNPADPMEFVRRGYRYVANL